MNRPDSSLLAMPTLPVSEMRGKNAARAAPMLALARDQLLLGLARRRAAAPARRTAAPAGRSGSVTRRRRRRPRGRSAGSGWPSSSASAFWSSARWRCSCASVTRAPSSSDSRLAEVELGRQRRCRSAACVRRSDSSRVRQRLRASAPAAPRRRRSAEVGVGDRGDQADLRRLAAFFGGQVLRQRRFAQAARCGRRSRARRRVTPRPTRVDAARCSPLARRACARPLAPAPTVGSWSARRMRTARAPARC